VGLAAGVVSMDERVLRDVSGRVLEIAGSSGGGDPVADLLRARFPTGVALPGVAR